MKSGGFVFEEHEREADRWCAQYEHWLALVTKERNNRREEEREKTKTGRAKQASAAMPKPNSSLKLLLSQCTVNTHLK